MIGTWTEYQGRQAGARTPTSWPRAARRHAGPDAGDAGTDAGAVSPNLPILRRRLNLHPCADDAGAHAPTDAPAHLRPDDTGALRVAVAGAYASANTNTDAGPVPYDTAPDARARP